MTAGEKTSLAKMVSTRSADVRPGAEPFVDVVTGRGNLARHKGSGQPAGGPALKRQAVKIMRRLEAIHTHPPSWDPGLWPGWPFGTPAWEAGMRVADLMETNLRTISTESTIGEVVQQLADRNVSGLPV